jgi:hypothetical protein
MTGECQAAQTCRAGNAALFVGAVLEPSKGAVNAPQLRSGVRICAHGASNALIFAPLVLVRARSAIRTDFVDDHMLSGWTDGNTVQAVGGRRFTPNALIALASIQEHPSAACARRLELVRVPQAVRPGIIASLARRAARRAPLAF